MYQSNSAVCFAVLLSSKRRSWSQDHSSPMQDGLGLDLEIHGLVLVLRCLVLVLDYNSGLGLGHGQDQDQICMRSKNHHLDYLENCNITLHLSLVHYIYLLYFTLRHFPYSVPKQEGILCRHVSSTCRRCTCACQQPWLGETVLLKFVFVKCNRHLKKLL